MQCFITPYGSKRYYIKGKRVSKYKFFKKHPNFNEKKCILQKIKHDIKENGLLVKCEKKLKECNENLLEMNRNIYEGIQHLLNEIKEDRKDNRQIDKLKKDLELCIKNRQNTKLELEKLENIQTKLSLEHKEALKSLLDLKDVKEENKQLYNDLKIKKEFEDEIKELLELKNSKDLDLDEDLRNEIIGE